MIGLDAEDRAVLACCRSELLGPTETPARRNERLKLPGTKEESIPSCCVPLADRHVHRAKPRNLRLTLQASY